MPILIGSEGGTTGHSPNGESVLHRRFSSAPLPPASRRTCAHAIDMTLIMQDNANKDIARFNGGIVREVRSVCAPPA